MSNTKTILGFAAGAAAGILAGILLAPDKGANTRKKIAGKANEVTDGVQASLENFINEVKKAYAGGKDEVEELSEKAKAKINALKAEVKANLS
jgi:gas vesicle protein